MRVATLGVIPDDGAGRVERVELGKLRPGRHTLRLAVAAGTGAHGLCVYGDSSAPLRIVTAATASPR